MVSQQLPTAPDRWHSDPDGVVIEREGEAVGQVPAERIRLDFPELDARAEANAALDSRGHIWAAIGYSVGRQHRASKGYERLFHSADGGRTWTSQILPMTERANFLGFTVLQDDAMVLVTGLPRDDPLWRKKVRVWRSEDLGKTWQQTGEIPCDPYEHIGEGFLSMTQLADGTILLPITRWTDRGEERTLLHSVFASTDGGKSFPVAYPTFPHSHEAHVIQLKSGRLLGAFRYQRPRHAGAGNGRRPRHAGETDEQITAFGGHPNWRHPRSRKRARSVFKHVFIGDSDDNGRTWKDLRAVRDRDGRPLLDFGEPHGQLVQVPDGRVVLVHDCRYPYEHAHTRARISNDEGQTWEPEIYHISAGMGYPASVALPDGTTVTITGTTKLDARFRPIRGWQVHAIRWKLPGPR